MANASPLTEIFRGLALSPSKRIQEFYNRGRDHFERRVEEQRSFVNSMATTDGSASPERMHESKESLAVDPMRTSHQTVLSQDALELDLDVDDDGCLHVDTEDNADRLYIINGGPGSFVYSYDDNTQSASQIQANEFTNASPSKLNLDKPLPQITSLKSPWPERPKPQVQEWKDKLTSQGRQALNYATEPRDRLSRAEWEEDLMITNIIRVIIRLLEDDCIFIYHKLTLPLGPASCSHPMCRYKQPRHIRCNSPCISIESRVINSMLESAADLQVAQDGLIVYRRDMPKVTEYHRSLIRMWFCIKCMEDLWSRNRNVSTSVAAGHASSSATVPNSAPTVTLQVNNHHLSTARSPLNQSARTPSPLDQYTGPSLSVPRNVVPRKRVATSTGSPERKRSPRIRLVEDADTQMDGTLTEMPSDLLLLDGAADSLSPDSTGPVIIDLCGSSSIGVEEDSNKPSPSGSSDIQETDVHQWLKATAKHNKPARIHDFAFKYDLIPKRSRADVQASKAQDRQPRKRVYTTPDPEESVYDPWGHIPETPIKRRQLSVELAPDGYLDERHDFPPTTAFQAIQSPPFIDRHNRFLKKRPSTPPPEESIPPPPLIHRFGVSETTCWDSPPAKLAKKLRAARAISRPPLFVVAQPQPGFNGKLPYKFKELWCFCRSPDNGRLMFQCSARDCLTGWFHAECLTGKEMQGVGAASWLCPICLEFSEHRTSTPKMLQKWSWERLLNDFVSPGVGDAYGLAGQNAEATSEEVEEYNDETQEYSETWEYDEAQDYSEEQDGSDGEESCEYRGIQALRDRKFPNGFSEVVHKKIEAVFSVADGEVSAPRVCSASLRSEEL